MSKKGVDIDQRTTELTSKRSRNKNIHESKCKLRKKIKCIETSLIVCITETKGDFENCVFTINKFKG